ncbi:hypothetical protein IDM40_20445 [Nocardiopsis sp. HNM0947]|uniref:Lipoprotein n=1 Tax=Nocardiopsis coralli TaxID=2772213 RepID=A0ABR9PB29_9ACTN|nr:hypothetical protein [Nocardiopsis coralli]MBE3001043.1 hypothetical protein [Nocardiopsis coralli]
MFSARVSTAAAVLALLAAAGCELPDAEEILPAPNGEETGERTAPAPEGDAATDAHRGSEGEEPPPGGAAQQDASDTLVRDYVTALAATSDPDRMREGLDLAEEGSAAHAYLRHHAGFAQAWVDAGTPLPDAEVHSVDGAHEVRRTREPGTHPVCAVHEHFTENDGRLADLRVDGTDPGPYLSEDDEATDDSEGVHATFLSAHRTVEDGTLVVTADLTTVDDVSLDLDGAVYVPEGSETEEPAAVSVGRYELDAGSGTHAAFIFPGAEPGGELRLGGCLAECSAMVDLALPVPD